METHTKSLEKISKEDAKLSDVARAQNLMHDAFPITRHGNAKSAIWNAYRKLKLNTERRARAIWHGEARRIDAHEMTALEHAALREAQNQYARSQQTIASLEATLRMGDPNFHRTQIDALQHLGGTQGSPLD